MEVEERDEPDEVFDRRWPAGLEAEATLRLKAISHLILLGSSKHKLHCCHCPLPGRPAHLCVVSVPPHVSEGAHLAGPEHRSCVDLFVLCRDKRKRQVHMLQWT